jgi:heme A synthase
VKAFKTLTGASTIATFLLISIGGLVRATKSGLGCGDDWPHCSGRLIPALEQRAQIIEYSHRLAAAVVVVLLATLVVFALRYYRHEPRILWATVAAFGLVMFQAILGMIVVVLHLNAISVVLHLGTALSLLALLIYISLAVRTPAEHVGDAALSKRARFAAAYVFVLLLVGSYVSGADAGYAFSDWPLMDGSLIPNLAIEAKAIHFFHRALAGIVGVIVFVVAFDILKKGAEFPAARRFAHVAAGLFAVEVAIGALNVWTELNSAAVTAHLAIGAAIWGTLVGAALVMSPAVARSERTALTKNPTMAEASGS